MDTSSHSSNWETASSSSSSSSNVEPWWPKNKGGQWNDDETSKPGRNPVKRTNCLPFKGAVPLGTYTGVSPIRGVEKQPEYLIEVFMRKNIRMNLEETSLTSTAENANQWERMYRITARGFGYSRRTQVVLHTVFFP